MPHYLVYDVEASKLFDYSLAADAPGQPRLAEIGMIFIGHDYKVEAKYEFLIKPVGWEMTPEAVEKTGLTNEYLHEHGGPASEALQLYSAAIDARRVMVGFNIAAYDMKVMRAEMRFAGIADRYMQTRSLCLMWATRGIVQARGKNGQLKNPTLEEACAFFGIEHGKHRAMGDAEACHQLMLKLVERNALPEPKSPYDKKAKPKKAAKRAPKVGLPGDDAEIDITDGDFIGGASEDGK